MKAIKILTICIISLITMSFFPMINKVKAQPPKTSIYEIAINTLNGEQLNLNNFKGKKLLIVNVASKCGYTSQYKDLQKLHELHGEKVVIIGVPCNQFGSQEPGTHNEIAEFCKKNYGVSFQMTQKVNVKGNDQHPLYGFLTKKALNGKEDSSVKWNFQKYLLNEEGMLISVFPSSTNPLDKQIINQL